MNDSRMATKIEAEAWATLVSAFYERNGRDPNETETDALIVTARQMAADGATGLQ